MMLIEAWSFEITTLLAGYLGTVALDAHLTMLQLATLAFLSLPFAVAIASTIRIGNLLGAGDGKRAEDAMYVTFVICFAFMAVCGVVFAAAADVLGYVFTNDREVIAATVAYVAAAFQLVSLTFILIIVRAIGMTSCLIV
jgi:MATE family multidrug resistance protein